MAPKLGCVFPFLLRVEGDFSPDISINRYPHLAIGPSFSRTPAPPPFSSMNSTPAPSRAAWRASTVRSRNSSPRSNRATVSGETLARTANSRTPKPTAARAILH